MSEARLGVATRELQEAQEKLDEKEAELGRVQAMYDTAMAEKQALLDDADACKRKMTAASELIGGLAGEKIRWTNQSKEFKASIDRSVAAAAWAAVVPNNSRHEICATSRRELLNLTLAITLTEEIK